MAGSSTRRTGRARRGLAAVGIVAVLLLAGLSGAWFWLAGELDAQVEAAIEAAAGEGVTVGCAGREVFGFPFRLGLRCQSTSVEAPAGALSVSGGAVRTVSQIYNPALIVAEADAPVSVTAEDLPPLQLDWQLARVSARFGLDGLSRLSVEVDAPRVETPGDAQTPAGTATAERFEVHARANGADLDLALSDLGLVVAPADGAASPPVDIAADMSVEGAAGWLSSGLPGGRIEAALRGSEGLVRALRIGPAGGTGAATISGPFAFSSDGELSGDFAVALDEPEAIAALVGEVVPAFSAIARQVAGALAFVGRQEEGRTVIDVTVRDGEASLGFIPLGDIPPI